MVLGVTGGIACGKSTVTEAFRALGVPVVSADQLAREAVRPGSATLAALVQRFGPGILLPDGQLNRAELAAIIFRDADARADLNRITHPAVATLAEQQLRQLRAAGHRLIAYEAPLLFEAGAENRVDAVLVVTATVEQQLSRLRQRDHLDEAQARDRLAAQMPLAEKLRRADYLIDNSGDLHETAAQVRQLFQHLTAPHVPPENRETHA